MTLRRIRRTDLIRLLRLLIRAAVSAGRAASVNVSAGNGIIAAAHAAGIVKMPIRSAAVVIVRIRRRLRRRSAAVTAGHAVPADALAGSGCNAERSVTDHVSRTCRAAVRVIVRP